MLSSTRNKSEDIIRKKKPNKTKTKNKSKEKEPTEGSSTKETMEMKPKK